MNNSDRQTSGQYFPPGWDQERVQRVIDYYDNQTEEEAVAEIENAESVDPPYTFDGETWVSVPTDLVPAVRELISRHAEHAKG